jgi:hypothetical protein
MSWVFFGIGIAVCMSFPSRADLFGPGRWRRDLPEARERLDALEAELDRRLEELRGLDARVGELESRLDFTERLLARTGEPTVS